MDGLRVRTKSITSIVRDHSPSANTSDFGLSASLKNYGPAQIIKKNGSRAWEFLFGNRPLLCPAVVPLDLLFFRRIFSNLHRRYGDANDEVPVAIFQRSVIRLLRMLSMEAIDFNAQEYDWDHSGAVGWYEFVTCWRRSKVSLVLSNAERIFVAMEDPDSCCVGRLISGLVTALIFVSCICFILGTLPDYKVQKAGCSTCEPEQLWIFDVLEGICVGVFTVEYVVRVALAPLSRTELLDYEKILELVTEHEDLYIPTPIVRFLRFVLQPMNLIDLAVVVPYYLELFIGSVSSNLTVLRVLRLTRLVRLVKMGRYFEVLQLVTRVLHNTIQVLNVLLIYLMLSVCFSSAVMYLIEGGEWDPDLQDYVRTSHEGERSITPFRSIPHTFWWCIVTFTTVGYGDMTPVSSAGKLVAACTMICGILVLAMPISAISMSFSKVWNEWVEERRMESESRMIDEIRVKTALDGLDCRSRLLFEVRDDQMDGVCESEFLGEVVFRDLPIDSGGEYVKEDTYIPLESNKEKDRGPVRKQFSNAHKHKAQGSLCVGYTWRPDAKNSMSNGIFGTLEVRVRGAAGLVASDWKKDGMRDLYAVVECWPTPPDLHDEAARKPDVRRTDTMMGTLNPVWDATFTFSFDWPNDWGPASVKEQILNGSAPLPRGLTSKSQEFDSILEDSGRQTAFTVPPSPQISKLTPAGGRFPERKTTAVTRVLQDHDEPQTANTAQSTRRQDMQQLANLYVAVAEIQESLRRIESRLHTSQEACVSPMFVSEENGALSQGTAPAAGGAYMAPSSPTGASAAPPTNTWPMGMRLSAVQVPGSVTDVLS